MSYLLIVNYIPEETLYFSLPIDEVEAERFTLEHAHGKVINSGSDDDMSYAEKVLGFVSCAVPPYAFDGKWLQYQIKESTLSKTSFLAVFVVGVMM